MARRIDVRHVKTGATILAVQTLGDIKILTQGVVAKRRREKHSTELYSRQGHLIAIIWDDGLNNPILLLIQDAPDHRPEPLFDLEHLL